MKSSILTYFAAKDAPADKGASAPTLEVPKVEAKPEPMSPSKAGGIKRPNA